MKKTFQSHVFDTFCEQLEELHPDLSEAKRRAISTHLTSTCIALLVENGQRLRELVGSTVIEYEQHRNIFQEHITFIKENTKLLLDHMKAEGFVTLDYDSVKKVKYLKPRTIVIGNMCTFLNKLNIKVLDFYKRVYKVDMNDQEQAKQATLF
jgi:hypothetical protein